MLTCFPTPYPDEWWYSVLCRYYVRSGWQSHATVRHELYESRLLVHGRLFPNGSCAKVVEQLPAGVFSTIDILQRQTLLPYYLRFYQQGKKKAILSALCEGKSGGVTSIELRTPKGTEGPKFCPVCYREDTEIFGELYWRREHQIPLMPLCPKHLCRLIQYEIPFPRLSEQFIPLAAVTPSACAKPVEGWEKSLTEILSQFLTLPFEVGPTNGYNNIVATLLEKGSQGAKIQTYGSLDGEKIIRACRELFGPEITNQYFPKPAPTVFSRMTKWQMTAPERYALLAVLAGLSAEQVFGPELQVGDPFLEEFIRYRDAGVGYQKNELAACLGINPKQLDSAARKYNIKPFWKQCAGNGAERRVESLRLQLTVEEKGRICKAAKAYGGGQMAVFARSLLLEAIEKLEKEGD